MDAERYGFNSDEEYEALYPTLEERLEQEKKADDSKKKTDNK